MNRFFFFVLLFSGVLHFVNAQKTSASVNASDHSQMDEVVILGTRGKLHRLTESPAPIDIIAVDNMMKVVAQPDVTSMLNYAEPSFVSAPQTQGDGSDHIDPAALRGLGPDQTLVLINGKRRHTSALVNINGTFGRGSVGTDLNAIPALAISRIEVLRDGAAAQYGSDAIAGVVNVELKKTIGTTVLINTGMNLTQFESTTEAAKGNFQAGIPTRYHKTFAADGQVGQIGLNHGLKLGRKGGFLNLTAFAFYRGPTNRAGGATGSITKTSLVGAPSTPDDLRLDEQYLRLRGLQRKDMRGQVGQSELLSGQLFSNGSVVLPGGGELYFFGGMSYRNGRSAGLFRKPGLRHVIIGEYPNGLLPKIFSDIWDASLAVGYKQDIAGWSVDIANVSGMNTFDFTVTNSQNSTTAGVANIVAAGPLRIDSTQQRFYAGGLGFFQNTVTLDAHRSFPALAGLTMAWGGAYRYEQYWQKNGEVASWANFNKRGTDQFVDPNGLKQVPAHTFVPTYTLDGQQIRLNERSYNNAGAESFPGFMPETAIHRDRHNLAAFVEAEQNFSPAFLVSGAVRYEYYTDFGYNLSGKITTRLKLGPSFVLRASASRGFRAPSLQQRYLFKVSTVIQSDNFEQRGSFPNETPLAAALGIPSLRPEISTNATAGFTVKKNGFTFIADAYFIFIRNKVLYTGSFRSTPEIASILRAFNAGTVIFFTNGLDTRTYGADVVAKYTLPLGRQQQLRFSIVGNFTHSEQVGPTHISDKLASQQHLFLSPPILAYLFSAVPKHKTFLSVHYDYKKWGVFFRQSLFGSALHVDGNSGNFYRFVDPVTYKDIPSSPAFVYMQETGLVFVSDVSVSYAFNKIVRLTLGVNNLFDAYTALINAEKGKFYAFQPDPTKPGYNTYLPSAPLTAKQLGWVNNDRLTSGYNIGNQFNYSRQVSVLSTAGRYVFAKIIFQW